MSRCCQPGRGATLEMVRAIAALVPDGPRVEAATAGARLCFADGDSLSGGADKVAAFLVRELEALADDARDRLRRACAEETVVGYPELASTRDDAERRLRDALALAAEGGTP